MTLANESTLIADLPLEREGLSFSTPGTWPHRGELYARPAATTDDLARSIAGVDQTLSEVLVLLYHVVYANQMLVDALHKQGVLSKEALPLPDPPLQAAGKGRA